MCDRVFPTVSRCDPAEHAKRRQGALRFHHVAVKLDSKAKEWVAEKGYDPVFGARPLKRFLQRNVETKLARSLISGEVGEGSDITFTVQNGELVEHVPVAKK